MNEKKQELALKLSKLYDEKGELLKSVEITTKYLSKARHFVVLNWYLSDYSIESE